MQELVRGRNGRLLCSSRLDHKAAQAGLKTTAEEFAANQNCSFLVQHGQTVTYADFENVFLTRTTMETSTNVTLRTPRIEEFGLFLQETIRAFCSLLLQHFSNETYGIEIARKCMLSVASSAYMSRVSTSSLSSALHGDTVVIEYNKMRYIQHAVASYKYYEGSAGRFADVLIVRDIKDVGGLRTGQKFQGRFTKPL